MSSEDAAPAGRRTHLAAGVCAGLTALVGVGVIVGWTLQIETMKRVAPGLTAMNPLTALACLAAGVSLLLQWFDPPAKWPRRIGIGLGVGVAVVGASRLLAIVTGFDPGLDLLLFNAALDGNRMAPQTASGLVLIGLALATLDVRLDSVRPAQVLALAAGGVAGVALIGYLYHSQAMYGIPTHIPIAVHTAACFALICVAILCARPDYGVMRVIVAPDLGGKLARRMIPIAVVAPVALGFVRLAAQRKDWVSLEVGSALLVVSIVMLFTTLIWISAAMISRSESKTAAAQARYRAVVEQTAEGIYLVDAHSKQIVECNSAFCALLGYSEDEAKHLTIYDFVSHSREDVDARFTSLLRGARRTFGQRVYRKRDGSTVEVQANASVIVVRGREMLCTVVHDITAQRAAERKIEEKNHQLEAAVKAEGDALKALQAAQNQLIQREKMAGLGQLVAGVAHEINNPLSFVANNVAVLQRDLADVIDVLKLYQRADSLLVEHGAELAGEIADLSQQIDLPVTLDNSADLLVRSRDGLKRIQEIVRNLRDFARLDEGTFQDADLNAGLSSTINIIAGAAKKRQVRIEPHFGAVGRYPCYAAKLNQVFMNLISNAIDASPPEGVVTVRSRQLADGGVEIEVEDQGAGIPLEIRDRIFDPFFTTKPVGEGTGLGLSISYGIVQDHRGTIDVTTEVGQGTRFVVRLPPVSGHG